MDALEKNHVFYNNSQLRAMRMIEQNWKTAHQQTKLV